MIGTVPPADPTAFIRARLPVLPVPAIPEIRLHKAIPTSRLATLADADEAGFGTPYWAYYWAGGLALARHVLDRPALVAGRRVLDLGAGSGLVAIAAARAGAASVIAAEVDRYAIAALRLNVAHNDARVVVAHQDLTPGAPPPVDLVLVGDLFYEQALAERVTAFLERCRAAGIDVLIGDPWRAWLPAARLRMLASYDVAETDSDVTRPSAVFAFDDAALG
ncbi:50S ribosomal protein L11 methyltransferase [Sphingomonas sp. AR_OL41]|uniref:class I SAM-dependent methyltransferase n=1 Tax=Sphingomonas sp. AR_OL41 TaxID=3042729 RepID=UPI00247FF750|nr:50S ribosomal protein L11 methyltransferase [Sphingomonas sp. AR_OL41]MDH7974403.1 50S ribosomal protein L11 methyltransferase [Sphingomonas sp. AR_OL41]